MGDQCSQVIHPIKIGLDADIWLKPVFDISHDLAERELIEPIFM